MISAPDIGLAHAHEAAVIAAMSRDYIEHGLGWSWRTARILKAIADPAVNVAVARKNGSAIGFGLMRYRDDEAHLLLFAVEPKYRRSGIGSALLRWLLDTALTAGIGVVYVEARESNTQARAFYRRHGFSEIALIPNMYSGEGGVRFAKDLWL